MNHHPYRPRWIGGTRRIGRQSPLPVQEGRTQRESTWREEERRRQAGEMLDGIGSAMLYVGLLGFLCFAPYSMWGWL